MAQSGALADFARLPPERKALVFIVIGALLGLLYFQFVFKSLNNQLDEARTAHDAALQTSMQLTNDIPKYDVERQHMKQLKQTIDENQKALPTEAELPAFYETLNRKILESGVELSNWAQKPEVQVETFVKVPIDIEITGTFLQLKRFFASLVQKNVNAAHDVDDGVEERERIVSIENLNLTNPIVKNGAIVLTARFTAATFRQEDQAVGSGSGSGAPAAVPTGAPPPPPPPTPNANQGSAAPPMPSAATPAGAKARVEQSLDKGAARNANATGVDEAKTPPGGGGSDRLKGGM